MLRRLIFLPFLVLSVAVGIVWLGCTQAEDIVTPVSTSEISLAAERLPSLPDGMIYELWVADNTDTVSLGRFGWNNQTRQFVDANGQGISGTFSLHEDILKYRTCFVSVETDPDNNETSPGPIMLIDNVTKPEENNIILRFPKIDSLWMTNAVYCLEATSDLDRNAHDGCGLWFASYGRQNKGITDTFGVLFDTVTDFDTFIDPGTTARIPNELLYYSVETTMVALPDSTFLLRDPNAAALLTHIGVRFALGYFDTTIPDTPEGTPYNYRGIKINASVPVSLQSSRTLGYDFFVTQDEIFPDVRKYGWKYQGWVMTPYLNSAPMTTRWRFTPPAYPYKLGGTNLFPGDTGVLLTTGKFSSILSPDESNPYCLPNPKAPFPGEDFLNSTALQAAFGIDSVQLMPNATGNIGTVFITLEPDNYILDTTNFPLFVSVSELPSNRTTLTPVGNNQLAFRMRPWTGAVRGDTYGFPVIYVSISRR
ncbi:hypothetical protein C3F09_00495 [candidate division GN15 bacterium]|uniref:Uncharacterized protein n=1 Tax=candidate division GN15 bacterium TaxID=2072418 RepID=A0A855X4U8_9BACT|nr:MAG: hypothetical protein C3F09_00495 [candidate division GN15 bacterium]